MRKNRLFESFIEIIIRFVAFFSIAAIGLIFLFIAREAWPVIIGTINDDIGPVSFKSLFSTKHWMPVSNRPQYSLLPLLLGSIKITSIAVSIAAPLGIASAAYNTLLAPKKLKEFIKPCIEILAGFPSVVIGFFGLMTLASLLQNIFGYEYRLNSFVCGIALSLAVIPIIFTITEDALNTIPKTFIDASYALGAQKWETIFHILIPAALPGIIAAVLLGIGRAFGETMIVLMVSGNAVMPSLDIFLPTRTMSATIGAEMAEVVFGDAHYAMLFLLGVILFLVSFSLNAFAELYVKKRMVRRLKGQ